MPCEWSYLENSSPYNSNNSLDMECDIKLEENSLHQFSDELDALFSDVILEPKFFSFFKNNIYSSPLEDGNGCQWPEMVPHNRVSNEDCMDIVKSEPSYNETHGLSPSDSVGSLSSSPESNSAFETKVQHSLETPPVSPPISADVTSTSVESETVLNSAQLMLPKPSLVRINPANIKIIHNMKELKPTFKQKPIVLQKKILQKALSVNPKSVVVQKLNSFNNTPANSGCAPVIFTSGQVGTIGGSSAITMFPNDCSGIETVVPACINNPNHCKPQILPLIKKEIDVVKKNDLNLKALKRQQRMIKNRESASLSRKKKKDYVTSLETKLSDLEHENSKLKMENDLLKSRIKELETDCRRNGKSPFLNTNVRKTATLLAALLMISININSLSMLSTNEQKMRAPKVNSETDLSGNVNLDKHGRSLLWVPSDDIPSAFTSRSSLTSNSTCPININQTESLRLEKELRQWIAVDEKRGGRYKNITKKPASPLHQLILQNHQNKIRVPNKMHKKTSSAVEIYQSPFPGSLPRRDDTFYVFSFSSDHLLVPAIAHNNTLRPKMSFVIPTINLNGSINFNGSVPMMQIDCEVLATRSIEFSEKDFKIFKPKEEVSRKGNNSTPVTVRTDSFKPYYVQRRHVRPSSEFDDGFEGYMNRLYQAVNTFP